MKFFKAKLKMGKLSESEKEKQRIIFIENRINNVNSIIKNIEEIYPLFFETGMVKGEGIQISKLEKIRESLIEIKQIDEFSIK